MNFNLSKFNPTQLAVGDFFIEQPNSVQANIAAEQAVIGGLLIDNSQYIVICTQLNARDFSEAIHQKIYSVMEELIKSGKPADLVTLSSELEARGINQASGENITAYLGEIANNTPSVANIKHYVQLIKEAAAKRNLLSLVENTRQSLQQPDKSTALIVDKLSSDLANLQAAYPSQVTLALHAINLADFLGMVLPNRELILAPWLPTQSLTMIYAFRGVGKTFVSLGIAYAVSTGSNFLGWRAARPQGVLFIDGEMPARVLQERLINIVGVNEKLVPTLLKIITPDLQPFGMPDISTIEGQRQIEHYITEEIELIIIDNISTLARTGRENESESWQPLQAWALKLRSQGKSVLFIHHSGKTGTQRGTSKREDVLDTVICLKRPQGYTADQGACFEVHYEKSRGFCGNDAKPFEALLSVDQNNKPCWLIRSLEESNYDKVVMMLNNGMAQKEISVELNIHKSNVCRYAKRAKEEGLLKAKQVTEINDDEF